MSNQYNAFKARWVMGSPFDIRTKDHLGQAIVDESKHSWFVGFAVPKSEWEPVFNHMRSIAASDVNCTAALCDQSGFNWKVEDCDQPDNPKNLGKASYPAGHMLIKFNRMRIMGPAPVLNENRELIVDKSRVKRGDWFWIAASTKFNGAPTVKTNAGMYQNLEALMFAHAGEEIVSESGDQVQQAVNFFGAVPGAGTPSPAAPVQQPVAPTAAPAPAAAYDLVTPPAAPVEERYSFQGNEYTKAQLLAMPGWSDELIAQHCTKM